MSTKDVSRRKPAARTAPTPGREAEVNRYLAAYIMGVANRLAAGASSHYRRHFNLGMSEWRTLMAIGSSRHRIMREVAQMADLDVALASKSLKLLLQRGWVAIEPTQGRGRASRVSLTAEGLEVYRQLRASAQRRQRRLLSAFSEAEAQALWSLLQRVEERVAYINDR